MPRRSRGPHLLEASQRFSFSRQAPPEALHRSSSEGPAHAESPINPASATAAILPSHLPIGILPPPVRHGRRRGDYAASLVASAMPRRLARAPPANQPSSVPYARWPARRTMAVTTITTPPASSLNGPTPISGMTRSSARPQRMRPHKAPLSHG